MTDGTKPLSILHLEDNPADASLIKHMVTQEIPACTIKHVETPEAYCSALQGGGYDLILSDYRMPHYDGDQALKFARDNFPDLPFIMVTGELGEDRAIETLKRGATDYVLKDNLKRLVPSIRRALEEAEVIRQRRQAEIRLQATFKELASAYEELRVQTDELAARNEQVELARQRYQDLFEFTPDAYLVTRPDGLVEEANRAAEMLFGMDAATLKRLRITEFGADAASGEELQAALSTSSLRLELSAIRLSRGDRSKDFYADVAIEPSPARDHSAPALRWMIRDVTVRKHNEAALRESEERLKLHIENSPLAVVEWGADLVVTRWSKGAERLFGWTASETIGRRIDMLNMIYADDIPAVEETMRRLTSGTERTVVSTNRNYTKEGGVVECTWYSSVLLDEQGTMSSVMSQVLDVTDQKQAIEELARFNRAAVDRELRMIELKQEVNDLCMGNDKPPRYPLEFMKHGPGMQ